MAGCGSEIGGACSGTCSGACGSSACQGTCYTGCQSSCKNSCSGGCTSCTSCTGCSNACKGCTSCTGTCSGGCTSDCTQQCTNTCLGACNVGCSNETQTTAYSTMTSYQGNKLEAAHINSISNFINYEVETRRGKVPTAISKSPGELIEPNDIDIIKNNLSLIGKSVNEIAASYITADAALRDEIIDAAIEAYDEEIKLI